MEAAGAVEELSHAIREAVGRGVPSSGGVTVLYSGGLDSSVLAWLLRSRGSTRLLTVGLEGAPDLGAGRSGAEHIGLPWTGRPIDPGPTSRASRLRVALDKEPSRRLASVQLGFGLALAESPDPVVVTGQGADELFWGYAHFRGLAPEEGRRRSAQDLVRLLEVDWPETERIAREAGRRLIAPFLDPVIRASVARVDVPLFEWTGESKPLLRQIAERLGLPSDLVHRPKKAMQYGTGLESWLRRARRSSADLRAAAR